MGITLFSNFAETATLPAWVKCVRSGSAYVYYKDGAVEAAANTPRLVDGMGLLCEKSSTNLLTYCRNFTNAAWSNNSNAALTQIGINGAANTASLLNVSTQIDFAQNITASTAQYVFSVWLKLEATNAGAVYISIDGTTFTEVNPLIDSWSRFYITSSLSNPSPTIRTSGKLLVDFAQLELGYYPTSPILTTSATATRNADLLTIEIDNLNTRGPVFTPQSGTFTIQAQTFYFNNKQCLAYFRNNAGTGDYLIVSADKNSTRVKYNIGYNQDYQYDLINADFDGNTRISNTICVSTSFNSTQQLVSVNGALPIDPTTTQAATYDFSGIELIYLGCKGAAGSDHFNGYIQKIEFNTSVLTQDQLNQNSNIQPSLISTF